MENGQRSTANLIMMSVYHMPFRGIARMTGGLVNMPMLDGLLMMVNGHFFKGLKYFLKERSKMLKAAKTKVVIPAQATKGERNMSGRKTAAGPLGLWARYKEKHPHIAQFLIFFILSNGITVLQLFLMPLFKSLFARTSLVNSNFQILQFWA
ncbi:hypothetical protein HMSSN036_17640 [Paenibacillus macerans]|nr:hypothetical protein HMSSN036_17640 [Paenibacillus macerans]